MMLRFLTISVLFLFTQAYAAQADHKFPRDLSRNGPWKTKLNWMTTTDRDNFKIHRKSGKTVVSQAGVSTLAVVDGRLRAYFQWAPTGDQNEKYFDHIAYVDYLDGNWSSPEIIEIDIDKENPRGYPFDPTIVPLPKGGFRLYFTVNNATQRGSKDLSIKSAISSDGISFVLETGDRLKLDGQSINDCAVIFFDDLWHLIAPNHDKAGVGYYATSPDGVTFERQDDLYHPGGAWLGNMVRHDNTVYFFGTGFTLRTSDFRRWELVQKHRLADPGVALFEGEMHVITVGR